MEIEVVVRLAAPDPWSFTVLDTLRRKLGLGEVTAVERMKSWTLTFDLAGDEAAFETTRRIMSQTALLANPNRDVWHVRAGDDCTVPATMWHKSDRANDASVIKVTDAEDIVGKAVLRVLRGRLGISGLADVCFSTIWVIEFAAGQPVPGRLAADIAVARYWRRGLLSNPHFQRAQVYPAEGYLSAGR